MCIRKYYIVILQHSQHSDLLLDKLLDKTTGDPWAMGSVLRCGRWVPTGYSHVLIHVLD